MKKLINFVTSILLIAVIIATGWGIILGVKFIISRFNLMETELAGSMIIAVSVFLLCTLILASAIRFIRPKGDIRLHPEKAYIYNDFINYYITIRESIQSEGVINYRFRSDMVLWAGKNVLKSYTLFNQYLYDFNPDNPKILEQAEKVIIEMRKELGQDTFGLKTGDMDKLIFISADNENKDMQTKKIKTS